MLEHWVQVRIAKHWTIQAKDGRYSGGMEAAAGWIAGWAAMYIDTVSSPRLAFLFFPPFCTYQLVSQPSVCCLLSPDGTCSHIVRA